MSALTALAADIQREHEAAHGKAREALEHARRAGELLIEAKGQLEHGAWLPWLSEHCGVSSRSAQRYMRLASRWGELESKHDTVSHLTLQGALDALAEPGEPGRIVARLESLADDLACTDSDDDELTARMADLKADALTVIDGIKDPRACARIADAARRGEQAAIERRLRAMRMVGRLVNLDVDFEKLGQGDAAFVCHSDGKEQSPLVFILASKEHPGFWYYAILYTAELEAGNVVEFGKRPVRSEALPTVLAHSSIDLPVCINACKRESFPVAHLWPSEAAA